jgi:hypothetical protein
LRLNSILFGTYSSHSTKWFSMRRILP